jgi:hypothetical protein
VPRSRFQPQVSASVRLERKDGTYAL